MGLYCSKPVERERDRDKEMDGRRERQRQTDTEAQRGLHLLRMAPPES